MYGLRELSSSCGGEEVIEDMLQEFQEFQEQYKTRGPYIKRASARMIVIYSLTWTFHPKRG